MRYRLRRLLRWFRWHRPRHVGGGRRITLDQLDASIKADYAPQLRALLAQESPFLTYIAANRPEPADPEWVRAIEWGAY